MLAAISYMQLCYLMVGLVEGICTMDHNVSP